MNKKVENLVLEQLSAIRTDMGRMSDRIETLAVEMRAMRHQMAGIATLQEHDHDEIASVKVRLDRIERRFELVDDRGK